MTAKNSPKNILNSLNNDCIYDIFSKLTNGDDFLNLAQVCTRFQDCAKEFFRQHHRYVQMKAKKDHQPTNKTVWCPERAEEMFRIFGHLIESINLWCTDDQSRSHQIFQLIARFCDKSLKNIHIAHFDPLIIECAQLPALQEISFFEAAPQNLTFNLPLKTVRISCMRDKNTCTWFLREFPGIEQADLFLLPLLTDDMFTEFLSQNQKLTNLSVNHCSKLTPSMLKTLCRYVPNLERLCFSLHIFSRKYADENPMVTTQEELLAPLKDLRRLKELNMQHCETLSFEKLIKFFVKHDLSIEDLTFTPPSPYIVTEWIPTLTTLKHVTFTRNIDIESLISVMKTQTSLETIYFDWDYHDQFKLVTSKYHMTKIIETLTYGKNLKKLYSFACRPYINLNTFETILSLAKYRVHVEIDVYDGDVHVPKNILEANNKWVKLNEIYVPKRKLTLRLR
ncbi:uncharacterized protein LOC116345395 [Contarinia nasturtii]|uniref:uncharacterized protein LOC116345395 n=1 Tax=Contarinia nasturtii TaxID=265458 RepID=UPI0012D48010|nr:uncharacterized protein LOC116345395 [Contarinia nasturtii]